VLLDGFPRTDAQAAALDEMLTGLGRAIAAVIVFDIDVDTVVRRLSGRRMCRANDHVYHVEFNPPAIEGLCDIDGSELYQRDDDRPEVVRTRFQTQWVEAAAPVIEYYRGRGLVSNLDAARRQDQVAASVDALLDSLAGPS
jgi:adenylate kinase